MRHFSLACRVGSALAALPLSVASAQTPAPPDANRREGTVLRIDGDALIVDLGASSGVGRGSIYTLFRPISVRHPITGRVLRDRFPIGAVSLNTVAQTLSIARPQSAPDRPPAVGDILVPDRVLLVSAPSAAPVSAPPAPPVARVTPVAPAPAAPTTAAATATAVVTPDEREFTETLVSTLGRSPEERIARYRGYLTRHPESTYRAAVVAEISWLARGGSPPPASPAEPARPPPPPELRGRADPARVLRQGDPAVIALQLPPDTAIARAVLYARPRGAQSFQTFALALEGDGYLRARFAPALVEAPGFEYFVEVSTPDGRSVPVLGAADAPLLVEVEEPPLPPRTRVGLSRVDLRAEYADVGSRTLAGGFRPQHFLSVEGDFLQRVRSPWLYGYRVGFGVYDGVAVPLADLNGTGPSTPARVIYGYHELEFSPSDFVHLIARVELGVHREGIVGGAQARMRLGDERRTNVVLGGELFRDVGQRAFFILNFRPAERLPMAAQGEVFNQSVAAGDPMFRFIMQVGYQFAPWITVSARGSYQLRNIENGGFGAGLNTTFDW